MTEIGQYRPRAARTRGPSFLLMAVGGLAAIIIAGQPWYEVPGTEVSFSGKDITGGLAQALPVVVLVGALLMLTLRTLGRRIVGVVVALAAIGMGWTGLVPNEPGSSEVLSKVRQQTLRSVSDTHEVGWSFGYGAAAALAFCGALTMVLHAHHWPRRSDRFSRGQVPDVALAGRAVRHGSADSSAASEPDDIWKAIDAGHDPTDPDGAAVTDPDGADDAGTDNTEIDAAETGPPGAGSADAVAADRTGPRRSEHDRLGREQQPPE